MNNWRNFPSCPLAWLRIEKGESLIERDPVDEVLQKSAELCGDVTRSSYGARYFNVCETKEEM
jgi:hypothetical protein